MPRPKYLFYVTVSVKGLPPEKRYRGGRVKGGAFARKADAIDFYNRMKAKGATVRFYTTECEWQELGHSNLAELD